MTKKSKLHKLLLRIFLMLSFASYSQLSKTHYIPPITCGSSGFAVAEEQYLYISTPSLEPVNFKVIQLGTNTFTGTVSRNAPFEYSIGGGQVTQFIAQIGSANTVLNNKGFIIEADNLVYATVRLNAGDGNQAGQITSKGLAALGKEFRVGAFTNLTSGNYNSTYVTFASILATENNTVVTFSNLKTGISLVNSTSGNNSYSVTLNNGESFIIATQGISTANRDGLIATKISSDKDIAVNCGSAIGTNGPSNSDYGIDQLVPALRIGNEYIFIKSTGQASVEVPLLVSNEEFDVTDVFLNGNTDASNPDYTIQPGKYLRLTGSNFAPTGNLHVRTSKNVFAFQSVGDNTRTDLANQNMFFVPPLSCETPKRIDNIPAINKVGNKTFSGRVTITTIAGSQLNFIVNGVDYTLGALQFQGFTVNGPNAVSGNPNYVTYTITGLTGNVSVISDGELYLAAIGSNDAATFGGYYSGFTFKPEVSYNSVNTSGFTNCIPNTSIAVSSLTDFDTFQWYENGVEIIGATSREFSPTNPGYYKVKATLTACGYEEFSDDIPVSLCADDYDNDGVNDNIDIDLDNDGILNCIESNLTPQINLANINSGTITMSPDFPIYNKNFNTQISTSINAVANPIVGNADGRFISEIPAGKSNYVTFKFSLTPTTSTLPLGLKYIQTGANSDLLNSDSEYIVSVPLDKTITVLNPDNQLLIDKNYDGIYESNVTEFTAFEIRFRYNGTIPLAAGTGTFSFKTIDSNSISLTHINLSETNTNKSSFQLFSDCIRDSYQGEISKKFDLDCDDDGILDFVEAQGANPIVRSNIDANIDGLDDAFGTGIIPIDTDNDGVPDYIDVDSDNDGIYDIVESGINLTGINNSFGSFTGNNFGINGLHNTVETTIDSGVLNYTLSDIDNDSKANYIDSDSDGDDCSDVIEAGFTDANNDSYLGANSPPNVDIIGRVSGTTDGYTVPNSDYNNAAPILISVQPQNTSICQLTTAQISVTTNNATSYQWQLSEDNGINWQNIANNTNYSGVFSNTLSIANTPSSFNNNQYRVVIQKTGNTCGKTSEKATLTLFDLPVLNSPITLVQCENDAVINGETLLNLRESESANLSSNFAVETFSYYKTENGAKTKDILQLISNPLSYSNAEGNTVWVRVENANNCFSVAQISIVVTSSQIPNTFHLTYPKCDDFIEGISTITDGLATFDFSEAKTEILALLPTTSSYNIIFYTNQNDASTEQNPIPETGADFTTISSYRNVIPNQQEIWVRVDSALSNECFALGPYITLKVNDKPDIKLTDLTYVCLNKPSEFIELTAAILDGSAVSNYTYDWYKDTVKLDLFTPTIRVNTVGEYTVIVTSLEGCNQERTITVEPSETAILQNISIEDLSDTNTILVAVNGLGDYEYSIDAPNSFQDSNQFDNIPSGIHQIYVKDKNGCGILGPLDVSVLGAPKFFTPNGDGFNDTWNISGFASGLNPSVLIKIFDRYGKLMKQISPEGAGWDGTLNGAPLPADDYWFTYEFETGRVFKSHFSLKR